MTADEAITEKAAVIEVLTLYVRERCHLCEEMRAALAPWCERFGVELEIVEIDEDLALLARFGNRVPVLVYGEREVCQHVLDERALCEALRDAQSAKA